MARSILVGLCLLAMLVGALGVPHVQAQAQPELQLITETALPNSRNVKFPHVATSRGEVHVSGTVNLSTATYWTKPETATEFPGGFGLGPSAGGLADYVVTSVAPAPDGAIYVAWTNLEQNRVYIRRRDASGSWGGARIVANANFPIFVEVGVASNGTVIVAWNEPSRSARYRSSTDQGTSWSSTSNLGDFQAYSDQMDIATGPNGQIVIVWTGVTSNRLQVFAALWNGGGFDLQRVTTFEGDYADATVTIAPDGKIYVGWRGTDGGVFYAERQPNGTWPRSRLTSNLAEGLVNVNADEQGNLHFNWIAKPGGSTQLFYAFKEAGGGFRGPLASSSGVIFNSHAAASVSASVYSHVVMEEFTGGGLRTRYALFRTQVNIFSGEPVIENGAPVVNGRAAVQVAFRNLRGSTPAGVRWRWGAPPSDAASDSGGFQPFTNPISVPVPQAIRESTACQPAVLYTQLRDTSGKLEETPKQTSILVDGVVEAETAVGNPYLYMNAGAGAPVAQLAAVAGAPAGDLRFTRIPLVYLEVISGDDCTGLQSIGIGRSAAKIETVLQIGDTGYKGFVPLPGLASLQDGPVPLLLQVTDGAGNQRSFETTIIFDEEQPRLDQTSPGSIVAAADPRADLIQTLRFQNIKVSDAQYGGRGFWGVWLANSRTPVADPANDPDLEWTPLMVPGTSSSFTVGSWSLSNGLDPQEVTAGTYYVYARFLDGAGNASAGAISVSLSSQAQRPSTYLPAIQK